MTATHSTRHPFFIEGCYLCRLRSVSVAPSVMPSRSGADHVRAANQLAKNWDKDIPAYEALVKDGLQPETVDGCADLMARAETKEEVESGQVLTPAGRAQLKEVLDG